VRRRREERRERERQFCKKERKDFYLLPLFLKGRAGSLFFSSIFKKEDACDSTVGREVKRGCWDGHLQRKRTNFFSPLKLQGPSSSSIGTLPNTRGRM
jgi:hypothetical protein